MCGIIGFYKNKQQKLELSEVEHQVKFLLKESSSRGKDAAGLSLLLEDELLISKSSGSASKYLGSQSYQNLIAFSKNKSLQAIIGQTRMVTHGSSSFHINNQPVIDSSGLVCVHNGLIINHQYLWKKIEKKRKAPELDSASLLRFFSDSYFRNKKNIFIAVKDLFSEAQGIINIAILIPEEFQLLIATNIGSVYFVITNIGLFFASEERIISFFLKKFKLRHDIHHLKAMSGCIMDTNKYDIFEI